MSAEQVVLLDEEGRATGAADKGQVHHAATPLHLAFSCHLFDAEGRTLLTRRAWGKKTWPGAWTNTCCGHPAPGETLVDAVRRRVGEELGLAIDDLRVLLPSFRYRATMDDGVTENEICPVLVGTARGRVSLDPDEVAEVAWTPWADLQGRVAAGSADLTPWAHTQVGLLPTHPWSASESLVGLPPALRP